MDPFLLVVIVVLLVGALGSWLVLTLPQARRGVPGRAPRQKPVDPSRAWLLERRRELGRREETVRAKYAQAVSVPGTDDRAAAKAEDVADPLAEGFLDARTAAREARGPLDPNPDRLRRRELARRVNLYQQAVTRLERAWAGVAAPELRRIRRHG